MKRLTPWLALLLLSAALPARAEDKPKSDDKPRFAGPTADGFLLPNGWTLRPAGKHLTLTDLPLNVVPLREGRHVLVATSGFNKHELSLIDINDMKVVAAPATTWRWGGWSRRSAAARCGRKPPSS